MNSQNYVKLDFASLEKAINECLEAFKYPPISSIESLLKSSSQGQQNLTDNKKNQAGTILWNTSAKGWHTITIKMHHQNRTAQYSDTTVFKSFDYQIKQDMLTIKSPDRKELPLKTNAYLKKKKLDVLLGDNEQIEGILNINEYKHNILEVVYKGAESTNVIQKIRPYTSKDRPDKWFIKGSNTTQRLELLLPSYVQKNNDYVQSYVHENNPKIYVQKNNSVHETIISRNEVKTIYCEGVATALTIWFASGRVHNVIATSSCDNLKKHIKYNLDNNKSITVCLDLDFICDENGNKKSVMLAYLDKFKNNDLLECVTFSHEFTGEEPSGYDINDSYCDTDKLPILDYINYAEYKKWLLKNTQIIVEGVQEKTISPHHYVNQDFELPTYGDKNTLLLPIRTFMATNNLQVNTSFGFREISDYTNIYDFINELYSSCFFLDNGEPAIYNKRSGVIYEVKKDMFPLFYKEINKRGDIKHIYLRSLLMHFPTSTLRPAFFASNHYQDNFQINGQYIYKNSENFVNTFKGIPAITGNVNEKFVGYFEEYFSCLADGKEEEARYAAQWIANIALGLKNGNYLRNKTTLMLNSRLGGGGKSCLATTLVPLLIGQQYCGKSGNIDFSGSFNKMLENKILINMEECAITKESLENIKDFISDKMLTIRPKYFEPYDIINQANLLFTNNKIHSIQAETGGVRRYILITQTPNSCWSKRSSELASFFYKEVEEGRGEDIRASFFSFLEKIHDPVLAEKVRIHGLDNDAIKEQINLTNPHSANIDVILEWFKDTDIALQQANKNTKSSVAVTLKDIRYMFDIKFGKPSDTMLAKLLKDAGLKSFSKRKQKQMVKAKSSLETREIEGSDKTTFYYLTEAEEYLQYTELNLQGLVYRSHWYSKLIEDLAYYDDNNQGNLGGQETNNKPPLQAEEKDNRLLVSDEEYIEHGKQTDLSCRCIYNINMIYELEFIGLSQDEARAKIMGKILDAEQNKQCTKHFYRLDEYILKIYNEG